jgi:hypothetical protein
MKMRARRKRRKKIKKKRNKNLCTRLLFILIAIRPYHEVRPLFFLILCSLKFARFRTFAFLRGYKDVYPIENALFTKRRKYFRFCQQLLPKVV